MCRRTIGRGFWRGPRSGPLLKPCLRGERRGEPPQWENQTDKGVVRPAARSARTRPRRTCSIFLLRWGCRAPLTDRRAAPGPRRAGGVWLAQIHPASRSPRPARGSRYSLPARAIQPAALAAGPAWRRAGRAPAERRKASRLVERSGRNLIAQSPPGCPQADARSLWSRLQPASAPRLRRAAGQPGSRASDRHPQGRDWPPEPTIAALRGQARNETSGQDQAQRRAGGQARGVGRRQTAGA